MKKAKFLSLVLALFSIVVLSGCDLFATTKFTITFFNGETQYAVKEYSAGKEFSFPENPEKDGYVFDGWYFSQNNQDVEFSIVYLENNTLSANLSVYARWKQAEHENDDLLTEVEKLVNLINANISQIGENQKLSFIYDYSFTLDEETEYSSIGQVSIWADEGVLNLSELSFAKHLNIPVETLIANKHLYDHTQISVNHEGVFISGIKNSDTFKYKTLFDIEEGDTPPLFFGGLDLENQTLTEEDLSFFFEGTDVAYTEVANDIVVTLSPKQDVEGDGLIVLKFEKATKKLMSINFQILDDNISAEIIIITTNQHLTHDIDQSFVEIEQEQLLDELMELMETNPPITLFLSMFAFSIGDNYNDQLFVDVNISSNNADAIVSVYQGVNFELKDHFFYSSYNFVASNPSVNEVYEMLEFYQSDGFSQYYILEIENTSIHKQIEVLFNLPTHSNFEVSAMLLNTNYEDTFANLDNNNFTVEANQTLLLVFLIEVYDGFDYYYFQEIEISVK